jgi:hypothetical protein
MLNKYWTQQMANNNHLYATTEMMLNTLLPPDIENYSYWLSLRRAKVEFDNIRIKEGIVSDLEDFARWVEHEYGIRIEQIDDTIGQGFEVVDEQKYLIYKLKFA